MALYVAGRTLPLLQASERRHQTGRRILLDELARQVAPDGGHREQSTHYLRYTLDFYILALAIARITGDPSEGDFALGVERLAEAARLLADDEGRLPHIGDDDGGMALPLTDRAPDDVRDSLTIAGALVDRPDLRIGETPKRRSGCSGTRHWTRHVMARTWKPARVRRSGRVCCGRAATTSPDQPITTWSSMVDRTDT